MRLAGTGCCLLIVVSIGCAHIPLRNNTVREARTVTEIYQQEVLNNLAMFAYDPNSLPHFSYANQGSTSINDQGNAGISAGWGRVGAGSTGYNPFNISALGLNLAGQRQLAEGFTMTPVNDPRKLELMRCAYQKAIAACTGRVPSTTCPDCQTRFKVFYTGDPDGDIASKTAGITTSECLGHRCWLGIGCKKCVPKDCKCLLVGEYCGVYVWVLPDGRDELSKLTLAILDYAINSAPVQSQKTVYYFLDERGLPTNYQSAVGMVTASVGVTERNESLLHLPRADLVTLREQLRSELEDLNAKIVAEQKLDHTTALTDLIPRQRALESKLAYLDSQLKVGALKEVYRGGPSTGTGSGNPAGQGGSGVLLFNQMRSTLGGVTGGSQ